jgi:hypothetical protein
VKAEFRTYRRGINPFDRLWLPLTRLEVNDILEGDTPSMGARRRPIAKAAAYL